MNKLKTVFQFEFLEMARKRSIIITTAIMALVLFGATFIPSLTGLKSDEPEGPSVVEPEGPTNSVDHIAFVLNDFYSKEVLVSVFGDVNIIADQTAAKEAVEKGTYSKVVVFTSVESYTLLANDLGAYDFDEAMITSAVTHLLRAQRLEDAGLNPDTVFEAYDVSVDVEYQLLGKSSSEGFFMAYFIMFAMYMLILFFGQSVSTSIAREKDSRTMELLITSTDTKSLIIGKVLAMGSLGILQMGLILGAGVLGFLINKGAYPDFVIAMIQGTMSLDVMLVYLLFSVLGYLLYLFIFASLGSLVSKVEDVGSSITPITLLFVMAFMIASFGLNMPDSKIVVVSSFIPFTSLFTMPIRYMLTTVDMWQILLASGLMLVGVIIIAWFSVYVYRYGSLNYGNKIKLKEVLGSFKKDK